MQMFMRLMLSQRSLRLPFFSFLSLYSVLWQWFPPFCPQIIYRFFCLIYSAVDSFQCIMHLCLFFSSSRSLVNISWIFLISASILFPRSWIIFTVIILISFSVRLPISTAFSCFSGVLSCPFTWDISSVQSLSRVRLFATPWIAAPGLPVHHQLPEFTQTHVHWVSDAIHPSHPLSAGVQPQWIQGIQSEDGVGEHQETIA